MWCFDENSAAVNWRQMKLSGRKITGPVIYGNYIIVGDGFGYLHWIAKKTGTFAARNYLDNTGIITAPIVHQNMLYAYTRGGILYAVKKNPS